MWDLEFSAEAEWDFELIFDHLAWSYTELGDEPDAAFRRAAERARGIRASVNVLAKSPFMGTLRPDIRVGLRFVRLEKTVIWFLPDEERTCVTVIALFFGAQDHIRHMLARLLQREEAEFADIRNGLLEGLAQTETGDLAQCSGEGAIRRAFERARASSCEDPSG